MNAFRSPSFSNDLAAALLLAGALAIAAPARGAAADDAERHRIAEERAAIEARYAARTRECRDRFIVTSCVDDAKVERRRGLDALRARRFSSSSSSWRVRKASSPRRRSTLASSTHDVTMKRSRHSRVRAA